jgi:hypothetical protein
LRGRSSLFAGGIAVALIFGGADARAEEPDTTANARRLYEDGLARYNVADYPAAIDLFRQAYLLTNAPELLYDIAQAHRLSGSGHCRLATQFYRSFLRNDPKTTKRASVEAAIDDLARCSDEEAAAERAALPTPAPQPIGTAPRAASRERSLGPWIVGGAGAVVALTGGALLLWSRLRWDAIEESGCAPACDPSRTSAPRTGQLAGALALTVGSALAVTGVVLWFVGDTKASDRQARWLNASRGFVF